METSTPSAWLLDNAHLLPPGGRVLDVACGRGRHALWMAKAGFDVRAIDRNARAIEELREMAARVNVTIDAEVIDLETDPPPDLGVAVYDVVLGFHYLHRPLMPRLKDAVKPGGRIVYETFSARQAERGHPRNPEFLLKDGELAALLAPFEVLRSREGEVDGRFMASIVGARPK